MEDAVFSLLTDAQLPEFRDFCNLHWGSRHPIINDDRLFDFYFRRGGELRFALARTPGGIQSVCGFIAASDSDNPDIWISFILTKKGAPHGLGFGLLEYIKKTTRCRTIACNNIRKKTRGLYEFFGYTVADAVQYYRLNSELTDYTICSISHRYIPSVASEGVAFRPVDVGSLKAFPFSRYAENRPYKDATYVKRRFFENPYLTYELFRLDDGGESALLALRDIESDNGAHALRVADFIGFRPLMSRLGPGVDALIRERGAEFCDFYAYGADPEAMAASGFTPRTENDDNIIPTYLQPLELSNTDFTVFVSDPDNYLMCKADGDQDRPNLG